MKRYRFKNRAGLEFDAYASCIENAEVRLHEILRERALEFRLYSITTL